MLSNSSLLILFFAVLPAILLIAFIRYKDREHPEPFSWICKGVLFGMLSVMVSLGFSSILVLFRTHLYDNVPILGGIFSAFYDAALPEESAKLIMLWLLLRHNPYFDERLDGLVYAVCVGMGFAAVENIQYLFMAEDVIGTAVTRAILAVPGHYAFAITMGFFYSLVHFDKARYGKYRVLIWFAPFMLHGIYDSLCFVMNELPLLGNLIALLLYYFCYKMQKMCMRYIDRIQQIDQNEKDIRIFTNAMNHGQQ